MRSFRVLLAACALLLPLRAGADLLVHAAASLSDVLAEIAADHEASTGRAVTLSVGASSTLARQIAAGAPGDVFVSADEARVDELDRASLLAPGTRTPLLTNELVIVVPSDSAVSLASSADLAGPRIRSVALADPGSVPAGTYAKAHLVAIGAWERVSPKVVPLDNVRSALAAVAAGNADAAIVYATDARTSPRVRVALRIPASDTPPIRYVAAILAASRAPEEARAFLARLRSAEAASAFERHGFGIIR